MTDNEKRLVESIVNFKENILKAQQYVKENFGVESEYDEKQNIFHIHTDNINEALNAVSAKEYVENEIGPEFVTVEYC